MDKFRCTCGTTGSPDEMFSGLECYACTLGVEEPEPEHIRRCRENAERWEYDPADEEGIPL